MALVTSTLIDGLVVMASRVKQTTCVAAEQVKGLAVLQNTQQTTYVAKYSKFTVKDLYVVHKTTCAAEHFMPNYSTIFQSLD